MSEQLTDEEQFEVLKKWWKENGTAIIVGIVIGLGAIVGFWKWNDYNKARSLGASALYDVFVSEVSGGKTEAVKSYESLKKDFEGTSYAALAALRMAAEEYNKGETGKALAHLKWAYANPGHDSIEHIARLRLARLLVAENKLPEAENLLQNVSEPPFDAQYAAIRGDIFYRQGNADKARTSYQLALDSASLKGKQREYVEMKLNDLGGNTGSDQQEAGKQ